MAELFRFFGTSFSFKEKSAAPQINVKTESGFAIFELNPIKLKENNGIKRKDIFVAESLIEENSDIINKIWKQEKANSKQPNLD